MTKRATLVLLLVIGVFPAKSRAQVAAPLGVRAHDNPSAASRTAAAPGVARRPPYAIVGRMALGVGGAVLGAAGGALFGANVLYQGKCACEDPGLEEALLGAAMGSVISSGIMAAIPKFSSTCGTAERIARGVAGSGVGAFLGGVVGAAMGGGGMVLGSLGGAGIGAGLASAC